MDILDETLSKAKEVFGVARQKTGEVVNTQKQKFDIAALESKRKKDFEQLGILYYNSIQAGESPSAEVEEIVAAIQDKNEKIARLRAELNAAKNKRICPKCGATIDADSVFCNLCGEKLVYDSEEQPEESADPSEE